MTAPVPGVPQAVPGPPTASAMFLTLAVAAGGEQRVRDGLADLAGLQRSVGFRLADAALTCVVGVGSAVWDRLFGGPRPAGLHPFRELTGARHHAPATPGDLLVHIRSSRSDLSFELARVLADRLGDAVRTLDEVHGFRYFDQRDLLGFVDGTENPSGAAAVAAVTIGDEDPAFAGGSYVITQKYVHDLAAWDALSTGEQERVIGRTKLSDIELPDDVKPGNSHVALNTVTDEDGTELQVLRHNMPFGSIGAGEFGTYYIGYARTPAVLERMLENMFLGDPPGNYDRILDFSTALTGNLYFVPTAEFLEDPTVPTLSTVISQPADGSLAIGDLKGTR
jgi:porphyrinogen peroxidase